jgi:hemoglobin
MTEASTGTLLERFGGAEGVAELVDEFYRRVEADEPLRAIYPEDLEPGKQKLKLFLVQWMGGPEGYSQLYGHPRLRRRHFPFVIDERLAGRWLRNMREAMTACSIDRESADIVFERFGPLAKHMVNANQPVPREPLGDMWMD